MAVSNLFESDFGSSEGTVSMTVTFDTVSLVVQQLIYVNPTTQNGALTMTGPVNETIITAPTAGQTITVDLTSANIVCVQQVVTDKFGTRTVTQLPGGEVMQFTWPV